MRELRDVRAKPFDNSRGDFHSPRPSQLTLRTPTSEGRERGDGGNGDEEDEIKKVKKAEIDGDAL